MSFVLLVTILGVLVVAGLGVCGVYALIKRS